MKTLYTLLVLISLLASAQGQILISGSNVDTLNTNLVLLNGTNAHTGVNTFAGTVTAGAGTVSLTSTSGGTVTANIGVFPFIQPSTLTGPLLTTSASSWILANRTTTSNVVLVLKGMAAQTGDLQEWLNSSGVMNGRFDNNGSLFVSNTIIATNGVTSSVSNTTVFTLTMPATTVPFTNTNAVSWAYFIDNTAVTGTAVKKNGVTIFSGLSLDITIMLRAGETFSETYTVGTPTLTGNVYP